VADLPGGAREFEPGDVARGSLARDRAPRAPRLNRSPMSTPRTLRVELHCHTVASPDGHITFDGLVRTARRRGIDVVAITDHDTIDGALDVRRFAERRDVGLRIVVGEERTLADGSHVIGLFLEEAIRSDTLPEAAREIDEQGGICVLPHPF